MDHQTDAREGNGTTIPSSDPEALQLDGSTSDEKPAEKPNGSETGLERVLSRIASRTSCPEPGPPPDGGLQAWTQSLMGHLVVFNTWGYIISFGVFQPYYVETLNHPPSDISWIGSVQIFLLFFVGTLSGRGTDAGFFKATFLLGSIFLLVGVFMTSLSTSSNRAVAIGIAASGAATGGLVFPVIVQQLLPKVGFGWTVRVLGFVMLALQAVAFTFIKPRLPPRKSGPLVELAAFLLNGVGVFGRLIPAYLADHYFGPLNTLVPFVMIAALLIYCWAAVVSPGGLTGFAVIYGLFAAGIQSLFPATTSSLTTDLKKTGVRMGMVFSTVSIACLTGSPLAGALIQERNGDYLGAQVFGGTVMMAGAAALVAARLAKTGKTFKVRV
ncbi:MAG: hypothetical protein Q9213_004871 [Squamulea squamosa]